MDRQETLLPCPLPACGGKAINQGRGILCRKCGIWLGDDTQARESGGAHKLWNTRPDSDAKYVPELVDGIHASIAQIQEAYNDPCGDIMWRAALARAMGIIKANVIKKLPKTSKAHEALSRANEISTKGE